MMLGPFLAVRESWVWFWTAKDVKDMDPILAIWIGFNIWVELGYILFP